MYNCEKCDYKTDYKSNYSRHTRTCIPNIVLKCKYCDIKYKTQGCLNNHQSTCKSRDDYEVKLEMSNKVAQEKLVAAKQELDEYKHTIIELKNQLAFEKKTVNDLAKQSSIKITNNTIDLSYEDMMRYINNDLPKLLQQAAEEQKKPEPEPQNLPNQPKPKKQTKKVRVKKTDN